MKGYISKIDIDELNRKRSEFWESRVEGNQEVWSTLRACCEQIEAADIPLFLEAAGIKPVKDCINLTYDIQGKSYEIPNYCVNPPHAYDRMLLKGTTIKNVAKNKDITLFVKHFDKTFEVTINDSSSVLSLKETVIEMYNQRMGDAVLELEGMRLFFGGKELKNDFELYTYGITSDSIILLNIRPK